MTESMTSREMFSAWLKIQIAENANPYPTGVQGFQGGVEAERERILALLQAHICPSCEQGYEVHGACSATLDDIALIEMESE
jgi:hypothetical protein